MSSDTAFPEPEHDIVVAGRMPTVTFTKVPNWVLLSGIKPQAQALYIQLRMHLNMTRGDEEVWPSQESLAARLGLSRVQSLTRYFEELEELGAIERKIERYSDRMRQRTKYTIHHLPPEGYDGPLNLAEWRDATEASKAAAEDTDDVPETTQPAATPPKAVRTPPVKKAAAAKAPAKRPARKKAEKSDEDRQLDEKAAAGADWWWGKRATKTTPATKGRLEQLVEQNLIPRYVGNRSSAYLATRTMIRNALRSGYDATTIGKALEQGRRPFPSRQQFEDACAAASGNPVDRRTGGTRAPSYDDEATWGARKRTKSAPVQNAPDDDEFGLRDLANPA
ncbi:helix-turn-helix domain-containing protein [Streptomyces sp. MBT27]|uniref:helix-turn-helix domain-containing protein n=1 Tax=Streptomyces sp. MBT27 TaxID=1488356 RepID=UPI00141FA21B|nr:helix-turn-helix domain-containing protein [Streptomyces sp. MBT27]